MLKKIISSFFIPTQVISPESKDLHNTVIVVTGGSSGIGKAIAEIATSQGATVVVIARHVDENKADGLCIKADIRNKAEVELAVQTILKKYGKIDVLINNAGIFLDKEFEKITETEYDSIINTNLKGTFFVAQAVVPSMKQHKSGTIINIGSKISHNTNVASRKVLYATTKYAIEGFSYALYKELCPFGIRVSCVMPGTVNTFVSLKSKDYLPPHELAFFIITMIKLKQVDFEGVVLKSVHQNI